MQCALGRLLRRALGDSGSCVCGFDNLEGRTNNTLVRSYGRFDRNMNPTGRLMTEQPSVTVLLL